MVRTRDREARNASSSGPSKMIKHVSFLDSRPASEQRPSSAHIRQIEPSLWEHLSAWSFGLRKETDSLPGDENHIPEARYTIVPPSALQGAYREQRYIAGGVDLTRDYALVGDASLMCRVSFK